MSLIKDVLLFPYRTGAKIADSLKVKPEDSSGTKTFKRVALGVVAPIVAVGLVVGAVQAVLAIQASMALMSAVPLTKLLPMMLVSPKIAGFMTALVVKAAVNVFGAGAVATGFAGMSKDAKGYVSDLLKSVPEKSQKESLSVTAAAAPDMDRGAGVRNLKSPGKNFNGLNVKQVVQQNHGAPGVMPRVA
ncbi:MAG: hypothetical protein V1721_09280 [Pseudomonadota bacterium]